MNDERKVTRRLMEALTACNEASYSQAIQAHDQQLPVLVRGNLECAGQRWRLTGTELVSVGMTEDEDGGTDPTGKERTT